MKVLTLEMVQKKTAALRIEQNNRLLSKKKRSRRKNHDFNNNIGNSFDSSNSYASMSDSSSCTSEDSLLSSSPLTMNMKHQQHNHGGRTWDSTKNKNGNFQSNKNYRNHIQQRHHNHHYVAMDCEMVGIGCNGQQSMLARVTIVDKNCKVLFDKYVKPTCKITDYRTFVSGILPEHLDESNAENLINMATCRGRVLDILRNKILVGHGLANDLKALCIFHPSHQIRDTAQWGPFMKIRFHDGVYWPRKLKDLVRENLRYEIQRPGKPHCPYEDATAALQLYQCVQQAWEQEIVQYTQQHSNESIINNPNQYRYDYYNKGQRQ